MAERTVAQLLREAATALDEQRGVGSATNMPAPDRTGEGRANRADDYFVSSAVDLSCPDLSCPVLCLDLCCPDLSVSEICNEEWKLEPDAKAAAKMFQTHLLKDADQKPTLKLTLDMHSNSRETIGDGVKKYLFSLCLNKVQTGLHLHLDYTDLDIVEIVSLLESQTVLTPENVDRVNHLALSWHLPNLTENNRRLLAQQILHHGVIVRRERQMVQLRKGLKDTRVLEMLKERPELASALFPRSAEAELEPEMIIERIVWPEPDSDEEEEIDDYCSVVAYLGQYISLASSSELQQLIEFWTGWAVLPDELYVSVDRDATYPTASTCFTTLKIPTGCGSYRDFCFKLGAAVSTTKFGFGRI
ncbi:unnamed protein product [Arctogadus glacialis]